MLFALVRFVTKPTNLAHLLAIDNKKNITITIIVFFFASTATIFSVFSVLSLLLIIHFIDICNTSSFLLFFSFVIKTSKNNQPFYSLPPLLLKFKFIPKYDIIISLLVYSINSISDIIHYYYCYHPLLLLLLLETEWQQVFCFENILDFKML